MHGYGEWTRIGAFTTYDLSICYNIELIKKIVAEFILINIASEQFICCINPDIIDSLIMLFVEVYTAKHHVIEQMCASFYSRIDDLLANSNLVRLTYYRQSL